MELPEMDNTRPYCVLATAPGFDQPQWYVRLPSGLYRSWWRCKEQGFAVHDACELTPVTRDFHVWTGDAIAIAECWIARERASKEATT